MADRVGEQLGNYRLTRLLGAGGFAEVYLGEHIHLETPAAIKVLYTKLASDDIDKFRTEARTIAHLIHPHIVRVLDFGVDDKTPFLVMDYATNGTLRQRHPKGQRLSLITVLSYVKQVADALQCAHDEKLIHRDVKPENMLLGRRDEVLLSDFGIALVAQSSRYQHTQDMAGTMSYMAPEQIQGKPRPASDQYALGIVIYEWLSGERPFQGSFTEVVAQHIAVPPPSLSAKVTGLSPAVEQVVMVALEKDPSKRFKTVQAFASALAQAAQVRPSNTKKLTDDVDNGTNVSLTQEQASPHSIQQKPPTFFTSPPSIDTPSDILVDKSADPSLNRTKPLAYNSKLGNTICAYRNHSHIVSDVAWSPDSNRIASSSYDQTVQIWDATTGHTLLTCLGHSAPVRVIVWSPDGTRLASASDDKTIVIWEAATGRKLLVYRGHSELVYTLLWSPDNMHIASSGYDKTIQIWDATTGNKLFHKDQLDLNYTMVWSPNSVYIASSGNNNTVCVWEASSGRNVAIYRNHSAWVYDVAWSSNSNQIASASYDGTVQVWSSTSGKNIRIYRNPFDINFAMTGTHTTSDIYDQTGYVWNATVDGTNFVYTGHSDKVRGVARSPNGVRLASANYSDSILIWNAVTGHPIYSYNRHADWVLTIAWASDSSRIVSGCRDGTAHVWVAP